MGRYDNCAWEERTDFSTIRELEFPEYILIELFKSLLLISIMNGTDRTT